MIKNILLLGFPEFHQQAFQLAQACNIPYAEIKIHSFPDGENKITLPSCLADHIIICRSLNQPNEKLIELFMAAASARSQGVTTISLIAPYLCYMRQDKAFHKGEVISQRVIGNMLAHYFDNLLTVDTHLHRIDHLSQAIPAQKAINLTATVPMAHFIQKNIKDALLIGPDSESKQWVAAIADHFYMDYCIATKERFDDQHVQINLPAADYKGRNIVLVDDVASTGKTLLTVAQQLSDYSPASISVLVTHALFVGDAITELQQANVSNIWSCDTIPHQTNRIFLAHFLAKAVNDFLLV